MTKKFFADKKDLTTLEKVFNVLDKKNLFSVHGGMSLLEFDDPSYEKYKNYCESTYVRKG
jgi:hypothetical protein